MAKAENPFKFGTVVAGNQFIDRTDKIKFVKDMMNSGNHLVIIAPRRYGKTSLSLYATADLGRPVINLNIQKVTDESDFARQLVKAVLQVYPTKKIRYAFSHFSVVPTFSTDPVTGKIEVSLSPTISGDTALEEAFELLEQAGSKNARPIVILDEFQAAADLNPNMFKKLRSIMQLQNNVNYILLGSQESMMREIFEKKKSPFYHFGTTLHLPQIPRDEFASYLSKSFGNVTNEDTEFICNEILDFTGGHPYYTQELSFYVWNEIKDRGKIGEDIIKTVVGNTITRKDYDYERLWAKMTANNKKLMKALASGTSMIYTKDFLNANGFNATSTVRGCTGKLLKDGYILYDELKKEYKIEDPFFKEWILKLY